MKFRVTFKGPDAVNETLYDLRKQNPDMHKDDVSDMVYGAIQGWVEYGEYVTIEFDTEAKTAIVVKNNNASIV